MNMAFLATAAAHHFYLVTTVIAGPSTVRNLKLTLPLKSLYLDMSRILFNLQLSLSLVLFSTVTIVIAHHSYAVPVYFPLGADYTTLFSLFCHHINIASLLTLGAGTHASVFLVRDHYSSFAVSGLLTETILYWCILTGYLTYTLISIGLHSFGLYIHNDTVQALGRCGDMFARQLHPI